LGVIQAKTNRFMELEGLRGLAAIIVVVDHLLFAFYPYLITGNKNLQHMRYEDNIHGTPLALLYAGTFAVAIFFVLSGFVLSIGFFQKNDETIIKKLASKRYLRLMLPALASTLICFILIKLGTSVAMDKTAAVTGSSWLNGAWAVDPSIFDAIYSGAIGIFMHGGGFYNSVLWTMKIEFFGSFLVFTFLLIAAKSRYRSVVYLALTVATFNTWYMPFILGMLIADLYSHGWFERIRKWSLLSPLLVLGAVILGGYPHRSAKDTMYEFMTIHIEGYKLNNEMFFLTVGATMLVIAVLLSARLGRLMRSRRISGLGKYTFSLYLVHLGVIYTVATPVFVGLYDSLGYNVAAILAILAVLPVVWAATVLFEKFIDDPSIRFSKYISDVYDDRREFVGMAKLRRTLGSFRDKGVWNSKKFKDDLIKSNELR